MTIQKFVQEVNKSFPAKDQIMKKIRCRGNIDKKVIDTWIATHYLKFKSPYNEDNDPLKELIFNTNIAEATIGVLSFYSKIYLKNEYREFASYNDSYRICLDSKKGNVVLFDDSYDDIDDIVGKSFNQFLEFLIEYQKWYRKLTYGTNYSEEVSFLKIKELIEQGLSVWWVRDLIHDFKI